MSDDQGTVRNVDTVREILKSACRRSEIAILVTPYVKFELNFLLLDQEVVHVTATMSREDALYGLKSPSLKVRFPYGHRIFCASTSLLGIGLALGRKSLRLAVPAALEDDDFRRAYRAEKVGRVPVTFSSRNYDLLVGHLINLSTGGARIQASKDFEDGEILVEDTIHLTIPLNPHITINTKAKVRHLADRSIGLEFRPALEGELLEALSRWTFQKKEEALSQFSYHEQEAAQGPEDHGPALGPEGPLVALIGGTTDLEAQLRLLLSGLPELRRLPATVQTLRTLAERPRTLVLYVFDSASPLHQKRASLLLAPLRGKVPFALVGTAIELGTLIQLANDWEAVMGCALGAGGEAQLPRLVAGVFGPG